jgi:hypothetical protein
MSRLIVENFSLHLQNAPLFKSQHLFPLLNLPGPVRPTRFKRRPHITGHKHPGGARRQVRQLPLRLRDRVMHLYAGSVFCGRAPSISPPASMMPATTVAALNTLRAAVPLHRQSRNDVDLQQPANVDPK